MNICDAVIKVRIRLNLDFCLRNLDKKYLFEEYYIIKEQIKFNEKEKLIILTLRNILNILLSIILEFKFKKQERN